jgi:16S rRNA (guanine527-N7)-methyltransferase
MSVRVQDFPESHSRSPDRTSGSYWWSPPVLAKLCLPLVRPGGRFVAVKGRSAQEELEAAAADLARLGAVAWEVRRCGEDILVEPTTVIEVTMGTERGSRAPRRGREKGSGSRRR